MEYMSCPEVAKNGAFLKEEYKNYVKKVAYQEFQNSGICG